MRIARAFAPISSTLCFCRVPSFASAIATFSAVWPPMVGSSASGFSRSMTLRTQSGVVRSASSGSVMIVAGFEFTRITVKPSSFRAFTACVPE